MPAKPSVSQSKLLARYGSRLRQSHEAHKNDEMKVNDFSNLPPGIDNGVAVLEVCGFREIPPGRKEHVGEFEFYAVGVMIDPEYHSVEDPPGSGKYKEVRVRGKQTRLREVLAETPNSQSKKKTFDDHYASILNEMRKLGCDTANVSVEELEARAASISQQQPYFKVRTSLLPAQPGQDARVYEQWNGPVDADWTPPDLTTSADQDNTAKPPQVSKPAPNGAAVRPAPPISRVAAPAPVAPPTPAAPPAPPPAQEPPADLEFGDIDSLLNLAINRDGTNEGADAQEKLRALALEAGMTEDQLDSDEITWEDVANFIKEGGEDEEGVVPQKGEVWKAQLYDPKLRKKSSKLSKIEIVAVDLEKETVDVKDLATKKVHKAVAFADLVADE